MRFFLLILKNLKRNKLRSALTALAVVALVFIYSMIVTVVGFLDSFTTEKSKDVKLLVNERFRLLSNFNRAHMDDIISDRSSLGKELRQIPGFDPDKHTIWHFVIFTLDPQMKDQDKTFFAVATYPEKIRTMTDNLKPEEFDPQWAELMKMPPSGIKGGGLVLGGTQAAKLKKKVGDVFTAKSVSHRDGTPLRQPIEMTFEVVGALPEESAWNDASFMDYEYLDRVLHEKKNEADGKITWAWLQVDDLKSAGQVSQTIERHLSELRCETSATANSRFMEPLKPMLWGIKWFLVPAILLVMAVILANTFSITVRERQTEIAVLKVLGFRSGHVLALVLGEAILVGTLAGLLGAAATFAAVNFSGGIRLTGMPVLRIPLTVFAWGPLIGVLTALAGGVIPAWIARRVKVAAVFAGTT